MTTQDIDIPEGWTSTNLGDITQIVSGSTPSTKEPSYWDGDIPWITPKDLSSFQGTIIYRGERNITPVGLQNSSAQMLPINTVLFSSRAPIGYVAIAGTEVCTNQGFKNMICDEVNSHYKFIYYWLKANTEQIEKLSSGSTFSEASASLMRSLPINLPTISEQKEIAAILSSFDDKIELLRKQNETLEKTAQTIFQEWFGKYSIDDELPEGWRVGKLGEEFNITIGRTPPRIEQEWFSDIPTGLKWISIKDIGNSGTYIFETSEYLTNEAVKKFNIPVIPKNTTILSFKMTVGKLAITTEDMLSNEAIAHLKIKNNSLTSEYIYLWLHGLDFNSLGSTSSIVVAINSTMIKNIDFIIPDTKVLQEFNEVITSIFSKLRHNSLEITSLINSRDTLLSKLMKEGVRMGEF